jgi:hypothetical protein
VGFFDRYLTPPPRPPGRRHHHEWAKPESALPATLVVDLMLARTDDVAVAVPVLRVYPNGFELYLAVRLRSPEFDRRLFPALHGMPASQVGIAPADVLQLAVVYADGHTASNVERPGRSGPGGVVRMVPSGGSGTRYDVVYWLHPLPPPGVVTLVCEWPGRGIPQAKVNIDGQQILDASRGVVALWTESQEPSS